MCLSKVSTLLEVFILGHCGPSTTGSNNNNNNNNNNNDLYGTIRS